jgi:hypothetical protein
MEVMSSLGQADTSPTEVLCKVLLTVAACRKENGMSLVVPGLVFLFEVYLCCFLDCSVN